MLKIESIPTMFYNKFGYSEDSLPTSDLFRGTFYLMRSIEWRVISVAIIEKIGDKITAKITYASGNYAIADVSNFGSSRYCNDWLTSQGLERVFFNSKNLAIYINSEVSK